MKLPNQVLTGCIAFASSACMLAMADQPAPTLRLPDTVAPTGYEAALNLDPNKDTFSGQIRIRVNVKEPVDTIWLNGTHLKVSSATLKSGGQNLTATVETPNDDFIGLKFNSSVPAGDGELHLEYAGEVRNQDTSGVFRMEDNGNRYIYTQFESTDARAAFPCFDEPSFKVPWQLTLTVPSSDTALSNTSVAKKETTGTETTYTFGETKPLPSYLIAFGVGPFEYVDAGKAGRRHIPVRIVTPKGHADEAKYAAEVTATMITRLEEYFGIPFPYDKSDQVAIPVTFGFGAMENAGMVTYGQTIILAKPSVDTTGRQRQYAFVAAHELAHQWFGDLVTTAWWNDIWLNEAFATWMEQKLIREWKPEWKTDVADVGAKLFAQAQDSLISARKIRQEIKTKDDISNAFDGTTYQKGAAVIAMFENYVGAETFRKGVHAYLQQYALRNATAPEFLDAISSASKKDVSKPFSSFLNQAGVPLVSVNLDCSSGAPTLHLKQQRFAPLGTKVDDSEQWQIPICVRYGSGETGSSACEVISQSSQDWTLKGSSCPAWVEANDKAIGYYRVNYGSNLIHSLSEGNVGDRLSAPERVDFMGNAAALSNAGKLPAADALSLVEKFASDPERSVVQSAADLALAPVAHQVPEELMANYQHFLQRNFQARAREIGWTPKPNEGDDVRLLRPGLLRLMATWGNDQELATEGRALADKWLDNHSSVDPNLVGAVLSTAAFHGDKEFFERLIISLKSTKDRQERERIINAMRWFRNPDAIEAGFNAVLDGSVPFIEGGGLLFGGQTNPNTRTMALQFLETHYDAILAKRPTGGGFDFGSVLPRVGNSYCDATSKEKLQQFFEPRVDKLLGARRTLSQVLEGIDDCIAEKAQQTPSVEAFLKRY